MTDEIEGFIREAARVRGIDPDVAVRVARSEGGVDEYAKRGTFATGSSWWPLQLHYGGQGYEYLGNVAGMGNGFTQLTGWQPGDPEAWRDSVRYALNRAKASGWGQWYGAAAAGVNQWGGIDRSVPWDAKAEVWDYERPQEPTVPSTPRLITTDDLNLREAPSAASKVLDMVKRGTAVEPLDTRAWRRVRANGREGWMAADYLEDAPASVEQPPAVPIPGYDPDTPAITQQHDWDCAQQATMWGLMSIGRHPTDPWMEADMLAKGVESTEVGLTDASGAGLAGWIRDQYGEFGIGAHNLSPVTYDRVLELAGQSPILIGGHRWGAAGHWCGVRRANNGVLELAQVGGTGPIYGQRTMDRAGWDQRGPWSAVVITKEP